jgi:hypothetical protein
MVTLQEVEKQLDAIGANNRYWGRAEVVELQHILVPGEKITACLNGRYQGGFATFVVTDQRLLLVDKKLFYLTVEDMRYDMISEVDFGAQLLSGTLKVCTPTKTLTFTSFKPRVLRQVSSYIQEHVMRVRHQYGLQLDTPQTAQPAAPPAAPITPAAPVAAASVAPVASVTQPLNGLYTAALGNQAVNSAEAAPIVDPLPIPQRRNPYVNPPFMMRRRIGRFGSIGTTPTPML